MDVPAQDVITRDNVTVKVNAIVYFRVLEANDAIVSVENFLYATSQLAQTTLRSVLGEVELDGLLSQREELNTRLQTILDEHTDAWGIKVSMVEIKTVDLPSEMQRAMARQAEAERERRAKVIHAEGEFQASQRLSDAAAVLAKEPLSIQLRYLSTLTEIGIEQNSTIVFPIPIDLLTPLVNMATEKQSGGEKSTSNETSQQLVDKSQCLRTRAGVWGSPLYDRAVRGQELPGWKAQRL